jgi:hypothetical protein
MTAGTHMNDKRIGWVVAVLLAAAGQSVNAEDFDGSKPMICATVEANACAADAACERGTPHSLGAPAFLRVNVAKKEVSGPQRTTPIKDIEKTDDQLLLMGTELGFGWTIAVERATGAMSSTMVNRDGAFALFGTCMLP